MIRITLEPPGGAEANLDMTRVLFSTATFTTQVNGAPGDFFLQVKDLGHVDAFITGSKIRLYIDEVVRFGGFLMTATRTWPFPVLDTTDDPQTVARYWELRGVDWNILWQKKIVWDSGNPTSHITKLYPLGTYDDTILDDILANYTDIMTMMAGSAIDRVGQAVLDIPSIMAGKGAPNGGAPWSAGDTLRDAFHAVARATGGIFYITPAEIVTYCDADTASSVYQLSDQPSGTDIGYRLLKITDAGDSLCNDAMVWGAALGSDQIVFSRNEDAASIAAHGRWQKAIYSAGLYKQASVDLVAATMVDGTPASLRGAKDNKQAFICTVNGALFGAAEKVNCISTVFGFARVLPVRKVAYTFPTPSEVFSELTLTYETDEPWSIFEQLWTKGLKYKPPQPCPNPPCIPNLPPVSECECGITDTFTRTVASGWGGVEASPSGDPYYVAQDYDASSYVDGSVAVLHHDGDSTNLASSWGDSTCMALIGASSGYAPSAFFDNLQGPYTATWRFKFDIIPDGYNDTVLGITNLYFRVGFETGFSNASEWTSVRGYIQVSSDATYGCIALEDNVGGYFPWPNKTVKTNWVANVWYRMRFEKDLNPTAIRFKVWKESDTEPAWDFDIAPTSSPGLEVALPDPYDYLTLYTGDVRRLWDSRSGSPNPIPLNVEFDDLDITGVTRCTAVQFDDFERTVTNGWGVATPSSKVWFGLGPGIPTLSVADGQGRHVNNLALSGQNGVAVDSPGPWDGDFTMVAKVKLVDIPIAGLFVYELIGLRDASLTGNSFDQRVIINFRDDTFGGPNLAFGPRTGSTVKVSKTWTEGQTYWIKWQKAGGSHSVKAWDSTVAEPASWDIEMTGDSTFTPDRFGAYSQGGSNTDPQIVYYDSIDFDYAGKPCYYVDGVPVYGGGSAVPATGEVDESGTNITGTTVTASRSYLPGSVRLWVNGLLLYRGTDFSETSPSTGVITMTTALVASDTVRMAYIATGYIS